MLRLQAVAAWFFSCFGAVLLGASIWLVPTNAFADGGSVGEECAYECLDSEDPACTQYCCEAGCGEDPGCFDECMAVVIGCSGSPSCDTPANPCTAKSQPCPFTEPFNVHCGQSTPRNNCEACKCRARPSSDVDCICRHQDA